MFFCRSRTAYAIGGYSWLTHAPQSLCDNSRGYEVWVHKMLGSGDAPFPKYGVEILGDIRFLHIRWGRDSRVVSISDFNAEGPGLNPGGDGEI